MPRRELMTITSSQKQRQSLPSVLLTLKLNGRLRRKHNMSIYLSTLPPPPSTFLSAVLAPSLSFTHYFSITLNLNISV